MTTTTRPRLTPHQTEVYKRIERQAERNGFARSENIASRGACEHLIAKGYIVAEEVVGPRGGITYKYSVVR